MENQSEEKITGNQPDKKNKKNKKRKGRIALLIIGIVVLLLIICALAGYLVFHHYYSLLDYKSASEWESADASEYDEDDEYETSDLEEMSEDDLADLEAEMEETLKSIATLETDTYNILLVGVDSRSDTNTGRSDCMILISVDEEDQRIVMTSFLRDIYLSIPGYGYNRLNAAFAYGGPDLLESTILANFGITVDKYVVVNFYTVMEFIDAVDGVDIEVTAEEIAVMNNYIKSHNSLLGNDEDTDIISEDDAGLLHLNGNQALAYARVRYVGTDFARTGRQREILEKVFEKMKDMSILDMVDLFEEFFPDITTDLTEGDFASLLLMLLDASSYSLDSMAIPATGTWSNANINGMAVLTIDFQANIDIWYELVNGDDE